MAARIFSGLAGGRRGARVVSLLAVAGLAACTVAVRESPTPPAQASSEPDASDEADGGGAGGSTADAGPSGPCEQAITAPPESLELDAFYARYLDAGIPVVSSPKTSDAALRQACRITTRMLAHRPDVRARMKANKALVAVIARTEKTTDIPDHADLYTAFPGTDWNTRARGLGGTVARPTTSCAEENMLCDASDPWVGENILVHELAHGVHNLGLAFADATFQARLDDAYAKAIAAGRWKDTYAATNAGEYFAEGVQSFFDTNLEASPADGVHGSVDTPSELLAHDPALHALVAEVFGSAAWKPSCP